MNNRMRWLLTLSCLLAAAALVVELRFAARRLFGSPAPTTTPGARADAGVGADGDAAAALDAERAAALAAVIDGPPPVAVIDEGVRIAEALRRRYGIDTGHRHADRLAAARRAQAELLDRLAFTAEDLRRTAAELGYDLDPARCGNACENVAELARIELSKRALRALADG